jgi:hypothetical protein
MRTILTLPRRGVNATCAKGREGFRKEVFRAGSDFAETEEAEVRAQQPAGVEQGAARRIGIKRDA